MTTFASDGSVITEPTPPAPSPAPDAPEVVDVETIDPEPADTEPDPVEPVPDDVVDAEVLTDLAVIDEPAPDEPWAHQSEWKYDWLDYHGDKLAFRVPNQNALTALYQASKTCTVEFTTQLMEKFVKRHLSQESIERLLERMSDPDDEPFASGDAGWNDLLTKISQIGGDRALKDAKALAAVQSGDGK